jgi:peptidoglycan biosynthesis protein MviN/MurJ (putative lipid II flippase)
VHAGLLLRGLVGPTAPDVHRYRPGPTVHRSLLRALAAAGIMALGLWWLLPEPQQWLDVPILTRAWWLMAAAAGGAGSYLLLLLVVGERPAQLMHRV